MSTATAPLRSPGRQAPGTHDVGPNPTAAAIMDVLRHREHHRGLSYLAVAGELDEAISQRSRHIALHVVGAHREAAGSHAHCPVVVLGATTIAGPVVVALDDDDHAGDLVTYAAAQAARTGTVLRAVHVWTGSAAEARHRRMSRHKSIGDADHLLGDILYEHVPDVRWERQVLHDRDSARALIDLSRSASLLVVGPRSRAPLQHDILGTTTTDLLGRTHCPLAVLPCSVRSACSSYTTPTAHS